MTLQNTGWVCFAPSGAISWRSFATTRDESLSGFLGQHWRTSWPAHEAMGWQCLEVNITPKVESLDAAIAETDREMPGCAFTVNRHFEELKTCAVYLTAPSGESQDVMGLWMEMDTGVATPAAMFRQVYGELKAAEIKRGYWPPQAEEDDSDGPPKLTEEDMNKIRTELREARMNDGELPSQ